MTTKWNFRNATEDEIHKSNILAKELEIHPTICLLLVQRGLTTPEQVRLFFNPQIKDLHDPFLMPDMKKAVDRLNEAIGNRENILIYGDYDVDGTTAVALVYKYLRPYCSSLYYYIPDRYDEGYGISFKGIDFAAENNYSLIISLDCGIKAIDKIDYASSKGIDFIICDHHMPDEKIPNAVAVLDAKRVDSKYPYEHLSGCGVGFKFMQAFAQSNGFNQKSLNSLLDLVAVSIASDIVPITGENRILAYYGLQLINSNPCLGLKSIIEICGLQTKEITISDIVFKIGPRINASGRMMKGEKAVDLLLATDHRSAKKKSEIINEFNEERRELDKKITEEANDIIANFEDISDNKAIIVYNPSWHKGIIGIVASRLTEKYYRPAIVLTKSSELITGSARSIAGFDIYSAIESCRDLLENFGGHTYAAGLSLKEENLSKFKDRMQEIASNQIAIEQMVPQIDVDIKLCLKDINQQFMNDLKKMSPFGPENHKPIFYTEHVQDYGTTKLVGRDQAHIKLEIIDNTADSPLHGIAFSKKQFYKGIKTNNPFNICYTLEENKFNGNTNLQLLIKDIKLKEI